MKHENHQNRLKRGIKEMGLDALLSEVQTIEVPISKKAEEDAQLLKVPLNQIFTNPEQPRKIFDEEKLKELSDSIRTQGIIQPIVVKPAQGGGYQIVAGERRFRASKMAGLTEIPVIVRDLSEEAVIVLALIENIQRHDLNPLEEAKALQRLVEDFYITHQKVAEMVGKSRASVTNALRLLSLDPQVKTWLEEELISVGHAKLLMTLHPNTQVSIAAAILEKGLSVRQTEDMIQAMEQGPKAQKPTKAQDPDILNLQNRLSEKLGAQVTIQHSAEGKGRLTIQYHTIDELEGILTHIT